MSSSQTRAFAARLAEDDAFRARVVENPRAALAECGLRDEPGLVPDVVKLPPKPELAVLGLDREPEPEPKPPTPRPPTPDPVSAQLFDPS
jgi:hypothetical protein